MTNTPFCLPENMSAEQFLSEYWQKKPLLIRQGLPQLIGMFEPEDILGLALDEDATARLIKQIPNVDNNGDYNTDDQDSEKQNWQWVVENSPLNESQFENLPTQWTTLVQNLEQWSPELGSLWQAFDFIPQWQRDDIMVSYAPAGGSVGRHYDDYDVFLAQGHGRRRWQLGKVCDETTEFLTNQPIRIFDDMGDVIFDEILEAGDVLYVPPKLSHYGVATDDCLTFSFGFRRPNLMQVLDSMVDTATSEPKLFIPLMLEQLPQPSGSLTNASVQSIKKQLISMLESPLGDSIITQAVSETVSKRQYDILTPEETLSNEEVRQIISEGGSLQMDYSSRIIYHKDKIYANGQLITDIDALATRLLSRLADGEALYVEDLDEVCNESIMEWLENSWVWLDF